MCIFGVVRYYKLKENEHFYLYMQGTNSKKMHKGGQNLEEEPITKRAFVSDLINVEDFRRGEFNLISSGCGTGKTYFVGRTLPEKITDVARHEMLLVTSRSLTVDQQIKVDGITRFNKYDDKLIRNWNGEEDDIDYIIDGGIRAMTYDKIIRIITERNAIGYETLSAVKLIVFDECHTLFSDRFIRDIGALRVWIRESLYGAKKIIIGLTATPDIVFFNQKAWGVQINSVNKVVIPGYVAKRMICTDFNSIPGLVCGSMLSGKTMIMCKTVADCYELSEQIPNSFVLISSSNKEKTSEMLRVRKIIADKETLPDKYRVERGFNEDGVMEYDEYPLNVLITTSTAREGFNLLERSGVRNIISCYTDSMSVVQFCGRARYDIDTLVVAYASKKSDNWATDEFLRAQESMFKDFLHSHEMSKWYQGVGHLVEGTASDVLRYVLGVGESKFIKYINKKWLAPQGISGKDGDRYKIWREEDKAEIVQKAIECNVMAIPPSAVRFITVINMLKDCLGYAVDNGRQRFNGVLHVYRLIVEFDANKISCDKIIDLGA